MTYSIYAVDTRDAIDRRLDNAANRDAMDSGVPEAGYAPEHTVLVLRDGLPVARCQASDLQYRFCGLRVSERRPFTPEEAALPAAQITGPDYYAGCVLRLPGGEALRVGHGGVTVIT